VDLFETAEEQRARRSSFFFVAISLLIIGLLFYAGYAAWERYKPLPQLPECEKINYAGGMLIGGGKIACYNDCPDNQFLHCKVRRII
jgi:hypothetical protein